MTIVTLSAHVFDDVSAGELCARARHPDSLKQAYPPMLEIRRIEEQKGEGGERKRSEGRR